MKALRASGSPRLEVAPGMEPLLLAAGIRDPRDALDPALGTPVAASRTTWVRRVAAGEGAVYVKCCVYATVKDVVLRIVSRRLVWHRARREWRSLELQERLGLPVVRRVAVGEIRRFGLLRASVLVTEALEGARRLDHFLRESAVSTDAAGAVARYAASLHLSGFVHGDLNARNVLVAGDRAEDVRSIDSARGRRLAWAGRLGSCHVRDLAPLVLAFRVFHGPAAARTFVDRYLGALGLPGSPKIGPRIEAEIERIGARENVRLARI